MALVTLRLRRGTASEWASANPILAVGEPGWETDNRQGKVGDGVNAWSNLQYSLGVSSGGGGGGGFSGTITASQISDATSLGLSLILAASQTAAQTAIGAVPTSRTINTKPLTSNVVLTAADIGLGAVNNTADAAKSVLSAATLTTPRTISGVSFNGSANISIRLDQLSAPTAAVDLNSQKITSLATPTGTNDAATKDYVDTAAGARVLTSTLEATIASTFAGITITVFYNSGGSVWPTLDVSQAADANVAWHFVGGDLAHLPPTVAGNAVWDRAA